MTSGKPWYKSKTKVGGLLLGVSAVFGTVGGYLTGTIEVTTAIQALLAECGVIAGIFGIRDLPLLNKGK